MHLVRMATLSLATRTVETVVPDLSGFVDGQRMKGSWARLDSARFEIAMHDAVAQTVEFGVVGGVDA